MSADVLERNVRALLVRSYVPALPAPHYRDRLEGLFLREVEARWSPLRRTIGRRSFGRRSAGLLVALAAALVALLFGWRALGTAEPLTREGILAHGQVALRSADDAWRAASVEEVARGIAFTGARLAVATPVRLPVDVLVRAGRLGVEPESEVELARRAEVELVTLVRGAAWFEDGTQRRALVSGVELELRATEVPAVAPLVSSSGSVPGRREAQAAPEPQTVPPPAQPVRTCTGRVVAAGGAPVTEFTIGLLAERLSNQTPPPVRRSFTSADGTFRWENPPAGKQRVFVHAAGFALASLGERDFTGAPAEVRVELVPGASVRGSVLDEQGDPVADALVLSEMDAPTDGLFFQDSERAFWLPIQARTGADGRFELAHLNLGQHILRASATGYAPVWLERVAVPAASAEELELQLGPGGTIAGRVTRADGGPWPDAQLVIVAMDQVARPRMSFALTRTDGDGSYAVEHLPPSTMIVVLLHDDHRPEVKPVEVREDEEVRADFSVPRSGLRLFGRVLDAEGAPLRRQNVGLFDRHNASWNQNWVASTTRDDGGYAFEGVQPGPYLLYLIDDIGHRLRCVDEIELAPAALGAEVEHDIHVSRATLAATIRAAATGAAVADATLILLRSDASGREEFAALGQSDASGGFTFTNLRPGTYSLTAYPTQGDLGFARGEPVLVGEDGHESVAVELTEGGSVDVLVHDAAGHALAGATLLFVDERGEEHAFTRIPFKDTEGSYHISGLRPGTYRVQALLAGFQGTPVSFRFDLGRTPEVPILLAPVPAR